MSAAVGTRAPVQGAVVDDALRTSDPGEAERLVRRIYPVARIHDSRSPFSYAHEVRGDERAVLARFRIGAWADIAVGFEDVLGVGQVLSGTYRATSNGEGVDPTAPFLLRPGSARSQSEGLDLLMVNLNEHALARFAGARNGVDGVRLRFPGVGPRPPGGAYWPTVVSHVRSMFEDPDLLANDLLRASATELLFAAALAAFPIEVVGRPGAATEAALPGAVRRAVAFIEDNADSAITVEDIAHAARLSIRGLQSAFRRHLDTTPGQALRAARLSAVHADLLVADPDADSVAGIARRRGFGHLGRFAAEYRAQYGALPSETLRRGVG